MKTKINNLTKLGMALGLTALMALTPGQASAHPGGGGGGGGGGGHHGGGSGGFYATVSTVSELISDINYVNTNGGAFTINLAAGTTFNLTGVSDELPDIAAGVDLTILANGDTLNRIDTYDKRTGTVNDYYRLFGVASGASLTVQDLTLNNGYGGVDNQGTLMLVSDILTTNYPGINNDTSGTVTITDSTLSNNGGGIYNAGTLTLLRDILSNNGSYGGGGVFNDTNATTTISDSVLSGCVAGDGGAISSGGTLTINNSTLSGNYTEGEGGEGGGIYIWGGTVAVSGSTISTNIANLFVYNNSGGFGGGIYVASGTLTISGSVVSGNLAGMGGGGIYNDSGSLTINNSTLSDNDASRVGGAICINGGTVAVSNSSLTNNTAIYYIEGNFGDPGTWNGYGGGIIVEGGALTISGSVVSANLSVLGGGLFIYSGGTATVQNYSSITGNLGSYPNSTAEDVDNLGALYLDSTSEIGILDGNPYTPF